MLNVHAVGNNRHFPCRNTRCNQAVRDGLRDGNNLAGTAASKADAEPRQRPASHQIVRREDEGEWAPAMGEGGDERRAQAVRVDEAGRVGDKSGQMPRRAQVTRGRKPGGDVQGQGGYPRQVRGQAGEKLRRSDNDDGELSRVRPP